MEGRRPNGLAVVLVNCNDPAQEDDFDRWYNEVHLPDVCNPGVFPRATRYQNPNAAGGDEQPRYAALYETDRDDPGAAWVDNREHTGGLRAQGRIHGALKASYVGVYKRIGGPSPAARPVTGVLIVLNNCADPARDAEFNAWYNDVHIPTCSPPAPTTRRRGTRTPTPTPAPATSPSTRPTPPTPSASLTC